ncbi:MAG: hypothetical protein JWO63_3012 [Frankiales bacterium]|nr:hypothetical protein [Frankiales bacterium]
MTASARRVWEPDRVTHPRAPEHTRSSASNQAGRTRPSHASPPPGRRPPERARTSGHQRPPRRGLWSRFTDRYGWRAYALPVLVVLTVVALATTRSPSAVKRVLGDSPASVATAAGPPPAPSTEKLKSDDPGAGALESQLPPMKLPPGPAYTTTGSGTYSIIPGTSAVIGQGTVHRFSIEVENGVTGIDLKSFAATVMSALSNAQSWTADGTTALQRVDSGPVDFHVTLVSSMTVRQLCGYELPVESSCFSAGAGNRVVLNVARWVRGAKAYSSDLATYRLYAVNHEVGHALGHNHAHNCLASGIAPVMMQQTFGTKTASGQICQPNPWPYPTGVKDAPGPEQPGDQADLNFYRLNSS